MIRYRFGDARVVLIDDSPGDLAPLEALLRAAGIDDLHTVTDPARAPDRLPRLEPDLVLLNLHVATDAFALLARIVRDAAGAYRPVLAVTTADATHASHRALSEGARDVLTRPFDETEALLRIGNLLETRHLHQQLRRVNHQLAEDLGKLTRQHSTDDAARQAKCDAVLAALTEDAFHLVFQPVVDLRTRHTLGYEALARFDLEPRRSPAQWFADASEVGLGYALELNALSQALQTLPELPANAFLTVNISAETLLHPELLTLADRQIAPRLVLDLTQRLPIEDYGSVCRALARLRHRGVRLAIDDTGAGYASLRHILTLAPDIIKLDASVVRGIHHDPARRALAAALVAFAVDTDTDLIAEGVETPDELETLTSLGVRWAQGHFLGLPRTLP